MNAAKILTVSAICLGLGISGAHNFALCFGSDGSLSIEAALDGACAGVRSSCGERELLLEETPASLRGVDEEGSCRDVVIGKDGVSAPLPSGTATKRLVERPGNTVGPVSADASMEQLSSASQGGGTCLARTGQRPPPSCTAVLRL